MDLPQDAKRLEPSHEPDEFVAGVRRVSGAVHDPKRAVQSTTNTDTTRIEFRQLANHRPPATVSDK